MLLVLRFALYHSAVACDGSCTGKGRPRPVLLVLAKGTQGIAKASEDDSVWNFPL